MSWGLGSRPRFSRLSPYIPASRCLLSSSRLLSSWTSRLRPLWLPRLLQIPYRRLSEKESLKGKLGDFFYLFKVFIGPKLRQVSIGNFHRKAPKLVKNQAKGSKIHKIRTKWHPTYCGNPPILSSELLWESTFYKFGHQPTVGIHQFCPLTCCGNPSICNVWWKCTMCNENVQCAMEIVHCAMKFVQCAMKMYNVQWNLCNVQWKCTMCNENCAIIHQTILKNSPHENCEEIYNVEK